MLLLIAFAFAIVHVALKPLADGLYDTSMWLAKIIGPPRTDDPKVDRLNLKIGQAALMDGWLSNIPFVESILLPVATIVGFIYAWWAGPAVFIFDIFLGVLANLVYGRSCSHYLYLIHMKMCNRVADYLAKADETRSEAAQSMLIDIEKVMSVYHESRLRPPNSNQLRAIEFGDIYGWLLKNK